MKIWLLNMIDFVAGEMVTLRLTTVSHYNLSIESKGAVHMYTFNHIYIRSTVLFYPSPCSHPSRGQNCRLNPRTIPITRRWTNVTGPCGKRWNGALDLLTWLMTTTGPDASVFLHLLGRIKPSWDTVMNVMMMAMLMMVMTMTTMITSTIHVGCCRVLGFAECDGIRLTSLTQGVLVRCGPLLELPLRGG